MADTYEVLSQRPRTESQPGGIFTRVVDVTIKTKPNGVVGVVTVPEQNYSAAEVDKVAAAKAALLEQVAQL